MTDTLTQGLGVLTGLQMVTELIL